jgi:2-polyprenyl-3-methyl-5-hydroxy-6-metoxy-1,4-benzoquinol methylase
MYFYEDFAENFDSVVNMYDTNKRIAVIFGELLPESLNEAELLDAGCGTGWLSVEAFHRGARVTSMDLGPKLLAEVEKKVTSRRVVGSVLDIPFPANYFDFVVCSEVIEHLPLKQIALDELYRVLKPGGTIVISTPNRLWYFALILARVFKLRPYNGLERWSGYFELQSTLKKSGFLIERTTGIHAFPFVFKKTEVLLDAIHHHRKFISPFMVNIAVRARK